MYRLIAALIALAVLWSIALSCDAHGGTDDEKNYADAYALAVAKSKPIAILVGADPRKIEGCVSVAMDEYNGSRLSRIVVGRPGAVGAVLSPTATDVEIAEALKRKAVGRVAVPFEEPSAERDDNMPWLGLAEVEKIKALWPKGVAWNPNVKWYNLRPLYQSLTTMNNGRTKVNSPTSIFDNDTLNGDGATLTVSGGMSGHNFRSFKGIDFVGKKVIVWQENTDVRAFALVPRWRWQFQQGTEAYDLLLNDDGGAFEVRKQTKGEAHGWETEVLFKDKNFRPKGYEGLKSQCASCHSLTAEVVDVPGRIYRRVRWGDDGRFSWRPFDESARLDRRWPIEEQ